MFRLGLIINPLAGIGGAVALKGSDNCADEALRRGATLRAPERVARCLNGLAGQADNIQLITWPGPMGEDIAKDCGFNPQVIGTIDSQSTTAADTENAARQIAAQGVDLLLFAGGDGTARNICDSLPAGQPVLGIPAGVKMHSGVFAVTPEAAARVASDLMAGKLVDIGEQEVRDIDEDAFRQGVVRARHYGELLVPREGQFVQAVKEGGREVEELVLKDIADYLLEELPADTLLIVGPGSTTRGVMEELGLENTLLGVDLVCDGKLLASDATAQQIVDALDNHNGSVRILVTPIGGQGILFGRGNHQISATVLRRVGREQIVVLATKSKLTELDGKPLLLDTNDPKLDAELAGFLQVVTGYRDQVIYPVGFGSD